MFDLHWSDSLFVVPPVLSEGGYGCRFFMVGMSAFQHVLRGPALPLSHRFPATAQELDDIKVNIIVAWHSVLAYGIECVI